MAAKIATILRELKEAKAADVNPTTKAWIVKSLQNQLDALMNEEMRQMELLAPHQGTKEAGRKA